MTRMSARLQHLAVLFFAAVHLLLGFICPVSSRIYRTNDAVVIEVDDVRPPLSPSAMRNSGILPPIPMMYAVNPYTGLSYQPYPNFPFWPYPLYKPASSFSDNADDVTATSPNSRQQNIACGKGPDAPPQRKTPDVGIVGGSDAVKNSWPFIVGLRMVGQRFVICGGSIISPTRILTAAHCVNGMSAYEILTMTVSLGMHNQGGFPDPEPSNDAQMTRRVTRVVYHTNYNDKTKHNDVAVLTVDPPIVYSAAISPVCLPPLNNAADQFVGKDAAIMGWGKLVAGGDRPNVLKQATVQIIPNEDCNAQYGAGTIFRQQFCASAPGKDTCQGDSGGPIAVQAEAGSTAWTQVGITSWGQGCANPDFAGVYASVAFFRNWIDTYMKN
ncbi:hypothetical protein DAPPUDRAFT_225026 [Daphnia pulex]|uniref:Peptidase S1 domain-containing protein n=1 Tax=Daphnia pulex TaxID=6669 RepID=E9GLL9_DAPPU|nr:hypothetical protein DAPPUDRAFT_225026 [Daphnia pulex]|eukprot:EFX79667.1 hypothetical protein DAPPUDRAFT_225026 [Daphnia pulex]